MSSVLSFGVYDVAKFGLVESFGIDDGQLAEFSVQEAFVLGYEFCQMCHNMNVFDAGNGQLMHSANIDRVTAAAEKRGQVVTVKHLHNDASESWCEISWKRK